MEKFSESLNILINTFDMRNLATHLQALSTFELVFTLSMYVIYCFFCAFFLHISRVSRLMKNDMKEVKIDFTSYFFLFISSIFLVLTEIMDYIFTLVLSFDRGIFSFLNISFVVICLVGIYIYLPFKNNQLKIQSEN